MAAMVMSFEGCIGAGKTTLTRYFSHILKCGKILEEYELNPFLKKFYKGSDVNLETEISFSLIHYSQLKNAIKNCKTNFILADFSIEKDLVFAKLNLSKKEFRVFEQVYDYVIDKVGVPYAVFYIDLSFNILKRRIFQRGRCYEIVADPIYFKKYNEKIKRYFINYSNSKLYFFNVDDLVLEPKNEKFKQIRDKILELIKGQQI